MSKTPVKSSISLADFEDRVNQGLIDPTHIAYLGRDSNGTTVLVKSLVEPEKKGRRPSPARYMSQTFLISDLTEFGIARLGQTSVTIGASLGTGTTAATISPKLGDATLSNWRIFTSIDQAAPPVIISSGVITSTTVATIRLTRPPSLMNLVSPGATDSDVLNPVYATDTQIDIGAGHSHVANAGGFSSHQHTHNNTHNHTLTFLGTAATASVDWMIIHI